MIKKCAVFSCKGLGDGLIALVLSHNLALNGHEVTTFHPFLGELQSWFPHVAICKFPEREETSSSLSRYDRFFIVYEKSEWMERILRHCEEHYSGQTTILNPIATPKTNYPYWENGRFDGNLPFVENLESYCRNVLKLPQVVKTNGIQIPKHLVSRKYSSRVVIHPTSSRPGKNWPFEKYLILSDRLSKLGFDLRFILTEQEKKELDLNIETPSFTSQEELAAYVAESGYMIGNDSGIGHLASCLGLPTLTICRSRQASNFWRPAWSKSIVITPSPLIPNLKGLRWRDKHWKKWISLSRVHNAFTEMCKK